jgi:hypothetical protein
VARGEQLGFRDGRDGTVLAIGPGYAVPLPPGAYRWDVVPGSTPGGPERLWIVSRERAAGVVAAVGVSTAFVAYWAMHVLAGMPH